MAITTGLYPAPERSPASPWPPCYFFAIAV